MPQIQGFESFETWIAMQAVPPQIARRAAQALLGRLSGNEELEQEELQLIEIYLGRPGANPASDQAIRQALSKPRRPSAKAQIPRHTPEWTNPNNSDPGIAGKSGVPGHSGSWTDHNTHDPGVAAGVVRGYDMVHRLNRDAQGKNIPTDVRHVQRLIHRVAGAG